jgi:hypothetical protein
MMRVELPAGNSPFARISRNQDLLSGVPCLISILPVSGHNINATTETDLWQ